MSGFFSCKCHACGHQWRSDDPSSSCPKCAEADRIPKNGKSIRTYYVSPMVDTDGTPCFTVQVVEDGLDEFFAYFKTEEEAQACMAAEIVRDAAPDLLAALSMGVTLRAAQRAFFKNRTQENLVASKQLEAAFDKAAHDAIAKATGAMTQGGLNL